MFSERDRQRLQDIIENSDAVFAYIDGLSFEDFKQDRRTYDATERCIERVIEASIQIGPEKMARILEAFPAAEARGLGNRLRHEYGTINKTVVWLTAKEDLPLLREACAQMLE